MSGQGNYKILGCLHCGLKKTYKTHSFGVYRVYINNDKSILKLKCRTCGTTQLFYLNKNKKILNITKEENENGTNKKT